MCENNIIEQEFEEEIKPMRDCKFFRSITVCSALKKVYCINEKCKFYKCREE